MHFEAAYEKRSSRSKSRSPLRSSLKRSRSFSVYNPSTAPLGGYSNALALVPAPAPALVPAPAPAPVAAPWIHGTRIAYPAPTPAYPTYSDQQHRVSVTYNHSYNVPGGYPTENPSYTHKPAIEIKTEYKPTYRPPPPPSDPLNNPEVQKAIEHERDLRLLSEQNHQETIRRQLLALEIEKTTAQRNKLQAEEESRQRMHNLYMLSQQQQQMQLMAYHHHHHQRSRSTHHRSRSRSRARDIEFDERRRALHVCGGCGHRGHYSVECKSHSTTHLLLDGPRSSAPALLPAPSRGRRSRRGSVASSDEEDFVAVYSDEDDDEYSSEWRKGVTVPSDSGVLVMYAPGGGPASRRSSVRHVVGV